MKKNDARKLSTDAQQEIQELANGIFKLIYDKVPVTCDTWQNTKINSLTLFQDEITLYQDFNQDLSILGNRRTKEYNSKISRLL